MQGIVVCNWEIGYSFNKYRNRSGIWILETRTERSSISLKKADQILVLHAFSRIAATKHLRHPDQLFWVSVGITQVMRFPRSVWSWSAFQVDSAVFMYGGVPSIAIPIEAIIQEDPKPKCTINKTRPGRQSLRRSLSTKRGFARSLSRIFWGGGHQSPTITGRHRDESAWAWGDWGPVGRVDQK